MNTGRTSNGEIQLEGISHSVRIDHCTFDFLHGTNVRFSGFLWGVLDHCIFRTEGEAAIHIRHDAWNGERWGHGSWADAPYWGSGKFIFIEDNTFTGAATPPKGIDSYEGARFVVRHNKFTNGLVTLHGTEGQGRGAKEVEIYNNSFDLDAQVAGGAGQIRAGSALIHDNRYKNVRNGMVLKVYRQFIYKRNWGWSDGKNSYDDNDPSKSPLARGKHDGDNDSVILFVAKAGWAANQWASPGGSCIVQNETSPTYMQSWVTSNSSDTIRYGQSTPALQFNNGDVFEIWRVVHSIDQPGMGRSDLMHGLPARPVAWPHEATEPIYSWNNTEGGMPLRVSSPQGSIKEGRDYFNETVKPNYKPYVYPHPLVSGSPAPRLEQGEPRAGGE